MIGLRDKKYYRQRRASRHNNSMRHINRRYRLLWMWGYYDWTLSNNHLTYPNQNPADVLEESDGWWRFKITPHRYYKNNLCQCSCYACSGEPYKFKGFGKRMWWEMGGQGDVVTMFRGTVIY